MDFWTGVLCNCDTYQNHTHYWTNAKPVLAIVRLANFCSSCALYWNFGYDHSVHVFHIIRTRNNSNSFLVIVTCLPICSLLFLAYCILCEQRD